jgi:hypothetical protein
LVNDGIDGTSSETIVWWDMLPNRALGRRSFFAAGGTFLGLLATRPARALGAPVEPLVEELERGGRAALRWGEPLFGLALGDRLETLRIVGLPPPWRGSLPVLVETPERRLLQIDVLRRDPLLGDAIAATERHALHLSTGDAPGTPTVEAWGLAVIALAGQVARREVEGAPFPSLLTRRERETRYPDGILAIAR